MLRLLELIQVESNPWFLQLIKNGLIQNVRTHWVFEILSSFVRYISLKNHSNLKQNVLLPEYAWVDEIAVKKFVPGNSL